VEVGLQPKGLQGATYAVLSQPGGFRVLAVEEERLVLASFGTDGKRLSSEDLIALKPELWAADPAMLDSAIMSGRFQDLPRDVLEACLRAGLSEMARHVHVYGGGLVQAGKGYGIVFGARTTLECEEAGSEAALSLERAIVFDATYNRVQDDTSLWIEKLPMDALPALDGESLRVAWLAEDGVYVGGAGSAPSRAVKFTTTWKVGDPPVHFFVPTPGGASMFALGIVERPMETVGQGESYLVLHLMDRADPSSLTVSRLALPRHPQAAAASWDGSSLGVVLFAEVRKPHAESSATVYRVVYDAKGSQVGGIETVLEWKDTMGKSYGMLEVVSAWGPGAWAAAVLYDRGWGGLIDLVTVTEAGTRQATHDMGWQGCEDLRLLPRGDGFIFMWTDKAVRALMVEPPFGVTTPSP